tara:strand:+ start:8626 stop:9381 length:756 start_codon:yes stop_codon:yes gene_type:complete
MGKKAIVFSCPHSTPEYPNDRADWLGQLIVDEKPDYVIDLGDSADMNSLNSFDTKNPKAIMSKNYQADIENHIDFQERIRAPLAKRKKKRPKFYGFEGNHEHRIKTAIAHDPRLEGVKYGISFSHLKTNKFYDEYFGYKNGAPQIKEIDGVLYAHWMGAYRPLSGMNHGRALIQKRLQSCTVGHSHLRNVSFEDSAGAIGLVAGCFKGGDESWAGQANEGWWRGVVIKHNIENGMYDPEFVSLKELERKYG